MNLLSWILLGLIALWLVYAVVRMVRNGGACSCGGSGCSSCSGCAVCANKGHCAHCKHKKCDH